MLCCITCVWECVVWVCARVFWEICLYVLYKTSVRHLSKNFKMENFKIHTEGFHGKNRIVALHSDGIRALIKMCFSWWFPFLLLFWWRWAMERFCLVLGGWLVYGLFSWLQLLFFSVKPSTNGIFTCSPTIAGPMKRSVNIIVSSKWMYRLTWQSRSRYVRWSVLGNMWDSLKQILFEMLFTNKPLESIFDFINEIMLLTNCDWVCLICLIFLFLTLLDR